MTKLATMAMAGVLVVAACAPVRDAPTVTFPPSSFGTGAVTSATATTRQALDRALATLGLFADVPQISYRPGESPRFTAAPRTVLEVALPGNAAPVYISIYEFANSDAAQVAGEEQAGYVSSPVGRVLFLTGTEFAIARTGATVIFYAWLPLEGDDRPTKIADALAGIGVKIEVPR